MEEKKRERKDKRMQGEEMKEEKGWREGEGKGG